MTKHPIIIDTDPGQDDAVALLLAMASPDEIDIRGITCVAGNVPLELTSANARRLVELAGRTDIPVYAGCPGPMLRPLVTAEYVHGKTGLDGCDLPPPSMALAEGHAVDFIVETCLAAGQA
ncbi:MAG: nucleoside hydrolase, partial [Alphaproteobacteria bacterium]|nr:nucleoside hydrolase [Alphaproteobacteria bacterium]